jgi:hypothetical protein
MIVELMILAIHMPPWIDYTIEMNNMGITVKYSLDSLMTFLMLMRFYLVIRLLTKYTKWQNSYS